VRKVKERIGRGATEKTAIHPKEGSKKPLAEGKKRFGAKVLVEGLNKIHQRWIIIQFE